MIPHIALRIKSDDWIVAGLVGKGVGVRGKLCCGVGTRAVLTSLRVDRGAGVSVSIAE